MPAFTRRSLRALLATSSCLNLSGLGGVTTYLRDVLSRGSGYRRPTRGRFGGSSVRGLVLGRRLDRAFDGYVRTGGRSRLLMPVLRRLQSCGLVVCGSQVRVGIRSVGLRTELDGVCLDRRGVCWVLELKNTQQTKSEHLGSYDEVSGVCPILMNGMVNSERVRHFLQTGFGMLAFSSCFGVEHVRGIVLVNCRDGCVAHVVDGAEYARLRHFSFGRARGSAVEEC